MNIPAAEKYKLMRFRSVLAASGCLTLLILFATPVHAQHGDWLMGTDGLLSAQQAPEGIFYSNVWSYYHASSSDFLTISHRRQDHSGPGVTIVTASTGSQA